MLRLFSFRLTSPSASRFRMIVFRIAVLALHTDSEEIVGFIAGSRREDRFGSRTQINPPLSKWAKIKTNLVKFLKEMRRINYPQAQPLVEAIKLGCGNIATE